MKKKYCKELSISVIPIVMILFSFYPGFLAALTLPTFKTSRPLLPPTPRHLPSSLYLSSSTSTPPPPPSPSSSFSLSPTSEYAQQILSSLSISSSQQDQLIALSSIIVSWNEKINLISRKDCTEGVVFGRHILPSIALSKIATNLEGKRVIDVGTGGGFPGIPLAILNPTCDFLLVDSVEKKLRVVECIAEELGLRNVKVFHGRAEDMVDDDPTSHKGSYDVVLGRSVTSLPRFCFWVKDFLKKEEGRLVYIIGGDVESIVEERVLKSVDIEDLLGGGMDGKVSDKRALVIECDDVKMVAKQSGEKKRKRGVGKKRSVTERKNALPKGAWVKRDNSVPKQRGYDNFKRYES